MAINRRQSRKNRIVIEVDWEGSIPTMHFDAELIEVEHGDGLTEFTVTRVEIDPDDDHRRSEEEFSDAYLQGQAPSFEQAEKIVMAALKAFAPEAF